MRNRRLYLDTSVWNFLFADDAPEKRDSTVEFFKMVSNKRHDIFISAVVIEEILKASKSKSDLLEQEILKFSPQQLVMESAVIELGEAYISSKVIPESKMADALHIAFATFYEMDALVSWNYKHLANLRKKELVNSINLQFGYSKELLMITPLEVIYED